MILSWKQLLDLKLERGHSFLASLLTPGGLVIDAGAHRCEFANALADRYGASVVALEPNTSLTPASVHPRVTLLQAALAAEDGQAAFCVAANPEASRLIDDPDTSEVTEMVPTRCLSSLMQEFNASEVDLLKLDIEGSEFEVLAHTPSEVLLRFKQVSVEFHPHNSKERSNLDRVEQALDRMTVIGFKGVKCSFNGYGDFLFINLSYTDADISIAPYVRKIRELLG